MGAEDQWFAGDASTGRSPILRYSDVTFFIDAEEYYADLRRQVTDAGEQRKDGLVCWIGFDASGATPMPAAPAVPELKPIARRGHLPDDRTWLDVLASATNQGTQVRALLNLHPSFKPPDRYVDANFSTVAKLNALRHTLAINDFRYLFMNGTHHQKLVIVRNDAGLTAYIGTMDVHPQRIVDRWCEVGCKVRGEAARELYRVFHARWQEHREVLAGLPPDRASIPRPEDVDVRARGGRLICQVAVTFGNSTRPSPFGPLGAKTQVVNQPHRLTIVRSTPIGVSPFLSGGGVSTPPVQLGNDFFVERDPAAPAMIRTARQQSPTYADAPWVLAPGGRTGIYKQIAAALERVRTHIYVEDQYLVDDLAMGSLPAVLDLLERRVKDPAFKKLIVLCTRLDEINAEFLGLAASHRRAFVERLVAAGGDKVVICQYKSNDQLGTGLEPGQNSPFYIHSKTWIFDDELLIVGSANCNRRGYSHDSELDLAVYDVEKAAIAELRRGLWLRRLNTEGIKQPLSDRDVRDFLAAARYWERPDEHGIIIENHRIGINRFVPHSAAQAIVLDGSGFGPAVDALALAKEAVARWMWDAVVDPDGT